MDYQKLGLKAGLEVHNQLDTTHKLFCKCSTAMQEKNPIAVIVRKQHPVASELGEFDVATQYEVLRDRVFVYETFRNETCHVELDEEPPHPLNREALETALMVALILNCKIPDEIQVMRKTVIDGSNTTSFQRTMVIGLKGFLNYKEKKIPIEQVSLEEDAAAIAKEENGTVIYRLNRLGIPLIEVATGVLEDFSPKEIEDVAFEIGMIVRSTGKAKKIIGAIRQDVNVSIEKGARTELKGIQELGLLSKVIENEIQRQISLLEVRNELKRRGLEKIHDEPVNVTELLKDSENKILKRIIEMNGNVFVILLPKFSGLLSKELFKGKTLGREFADVAIAFGVKGIFHSDEDLSKYNLEKDFKKIKEFLKVKEKDTIIVVGETKTRGRVSKELLEKARQILKGVEEGTRGVTPDGSTKFTRPLPGAKRMYPESDIVPISISKDLLKILKKNLPESWEKKMNRLRKIYKLSEALSTQIFKSNYFEIFEKIIKETKVEPRIVANTLTSVLRDLKKRENVNVENISDAHLMQLFKSLVEKKFVKESLPEILKYLANNPQKNVEEAIKRLGIKTLTQKELEKIARETLPKEKINFEKSVGLVMSKVRGKVEAEDVIKTVKKIMKR